MNQIIYGIHTVKTLLRSYPSCFKRIYILKTRKDKIIYKIIEKIKKHNLIYITLNNRQWFDKYTNNKVHQGIIAEIVSNKQYNEDDLNIIINKIKNPLLLILDCITDPHNLGTCLRNADAAGVNAIIIPKNKSASINATTKKVSCGAAEHIPVIKVTNIARTLRKLKQHLWIIGTSINGDRTLYKTKLTGAIAFVIGSENKGMRRLTREQCNEIVYIPMLGNISSLNVAVTTGICLFEAIRQRYYY